MAYIDAEQSWNIMAGLTKEQLLERRKGLGASDAARIMAGDWHSLWMQKTGRAEPEDLSAVWPVQLGTATEELNIRWYALKTGHAVTLQGQVMVSKEYPFLRCTLDGWDAEYSLVIEAKHVTGFSKIEEVRERYAPQVQHQMLVTGAKQAVLSVIVGASEPVLEMFERDEFWQTEYIEAARTFWGYIERDEEPTQGKPMEIAPVSIDPDKMRKVDMTGSNTWSAAAADWLANKDGAAKFTAATKSLKECVKADVKTASGHGVTISRDKRGLTIKETK